MIGTAAVVAPSPFWYLTRGTGAVALLLLTLTLCLGIANARRVGLTAVPRFVVDELHRYSSLLAVAFVALHVATALLDGYAPIGLLAVLIPGTAPYRPLWLGLGAVALDVLLAVLVTSLLRQRLGHRTWRLVHWLAYASWPTAMLHGLGSGSDTRSIWGLALTAVCVAAVTLSVVVRCARGRADHAAVRGAGAVAAIAVPIGLVVWLPSGPLARGWARRAGTPTVLLASSVAPTAPTAQSTGPAAGGFAVELRGTERTGPYGDDLAQVHLQLSFDGHSLSYLGVRIIGHPDGRGVAMTTSRVELGPAHHHALYHGQITSLQGSELTAAVVSDNGRRLAISAQLAIDAGARTVSGSARFLPLR